MMERSTNCVCFCVGDCASDAAYPRLIFFFSVSSGVLLGNKLDLSTRREVPAPVAEEWAQSQGLEYFETSAVG